MYLFIIVLLLIAYIVYREYSFDKERAELLLHIRSKNLEEYADIKKGIEAPVAELEQPDDLISLDDVEEEKFRELLANENKEE